MEAIKKGSARLPSFDPFNDLDLLPTESPNTEECFDTEWVNWMKSKH